MNAENRRKGIIEALENASLPVSAASLADIYGVTRQIIVADIALLRASGYGIRAEHKGYVLDKADASALTKKIAVKHDKESVCDEFYAIVDNGGRVLDVSVDHSVYGRISAELNVASRYDADKFVEKINLTGANPLSLLTYGLHIHTIAVENEESFLRIKDKLTELGIFIEAM
jgi:transcriptional regulator of NAD metabolism